MIKVLVFLYLMVGLICAAAMVFAMIYVSSHDHGKATAVVNKLNDIIDKLSFRLKVEWFLTVSINLIKLVLFWPIELTKPKCSNADELITMLSGAEEKLSNGNDTDKSIDI